KPTNLTYQHKHKLQKIHLPPITLYPQTEPFYPNPNFPSHLIPIPQKNPHTGQLKRPLALQKIFDTYLTGTKPPS
ncbi:hypothetical protein, partial [Staphylococcus haemolyticus]|uniref:hypothetical protein n=1 Tax=Staphylococcus haemolyticus TaxID=1283 RepID=UPI0021B1A2BD